MKAIEQYFHMLTFKSGRVSINCVTIPMNIFTCQFSGVNTGYQWRLSMEALALS